MILNHFYPRVPQTSEYQPLVNFAENSEVKTLHTGEKAAQYAGGNYGNHQRPLRRLLQETVHCFLLYLHRRDGLLFCGGARIPKARRGGHSRGVQALAGIGRPGAAHFGFTPGELKEKEGLKEFFGFR